MTIGAADDEVDAFDGQHTLTSATARGAAWNYAAFVGAKAITLLSTAVLARLLVPDDFGLLALGLTVTTFLDAMNDFGIGQAVIYLRERARRTANMAFAINMAVGVVLTALTILFAPVAATMLREPRVTVILIALAPTFLLTSFGSIQDARLRRSLAFRERTIAEVARSGVKGVVAIVLAMAGLGVWALVAGQLAGVAVWSATYWRLDRWRPGWFELDPRLARQILSYGSRVTLLGLLLIAVGNVDYVVIGRRLGTAALGYYTLAYRLPSLAIHQTGKVFSQVVFPAFSRIRDDGARLREGLLASIRAMAIVTVGIGVALAVAAEDIVHVVFGAKWAPAAPLLRVLALYSVATSLTHHDHDVYKAIGKPGVFNRILTIHLLLLVPVLWVAGGFGTEAVAWAHLTVAFVILALRVRILTRELALDVRRIGGALAPALVAGALMTATMLLVGDQVADWSPLAKLAVSGSSGAVVYASVLWLGWASWFREVAGLGSVGLKIRAKSADSTETVRRRSGAVR